MSCEFCNTYDFTSIAVRENNIHMAGGSSRFTDPDVNRGRYHLFNFCPLCGANLYYYDLAEEDAKHKLEQVKPVVVAVDGKGDRIDYAIFDTDSSMSEKVYYEISDLRMDCGVSFSLAKAAYTYAKARNGGYDMMVAYCKAKQISPNAGMFSTDKLVDKIMSDIQ